MKTMNLRTCAALLAVCLLSPACSAQARADTPKVTLKMGDSPVYELSVPALDKNNTMRVNPGADGKITIRTLLTLHLLRIPDCYGYTQKAVKDAFGGDSVKGKLGRDFPKNPRTLVAEDFNGTGDIMPAQSPAKLSVNENLYNAIRDFIPRSKQSDPNGLSLLAKAVDAGETGVATKILSADYAFAFGDSLDNARKARELALLGREAVHTENFDSFFKNTAGVQLLTDPDAINSGGSKDPLSQENFRNDGRWYFDEHEVASKDQPNPPKLQMMEVRVVWALEATFDPASPPQFPLVNIASAAANAVEGGKPGQDAAASSQPATPALGLAGLLGFTGTQLTGIGTPAQTPGVDVVGGFAIRDNGTPTMLGANVTLTNKGQSTDLRRILDPNRLGIMIGRTTDNQPAYITALSLKMNPSALLYLGPAFSNSGGLTRSGLSFGAAFNLLTLLSGNQKPSSSQADKEVEVVLVPGKLTPFPGKKDTQAAILWATHVPPTTPASDLETFTPTFRQGSAVPYKNEITFPRLASTGEPDRSFWLQFVDPSTLAEVTATRGTGHYRWSSQASGLYINQLVPPADPTAGPPTRTPLPYEEQRGFDVEASKTYAFEMTTAPLPGANGAGANPRRPSVGAARPLAARRTSLLPHRLALMHRLSAPASPQRVAAPALLSRAALSRAALSRAALSRAALSPAQVAFAAPQDLLPLPDAAPAADSELHGLISPPAGVPLSRIELQLWDVTDRVQLTAASAAFLADRKQDHFRWSVRPGAYRLHVVVTTARNKVLYDRPVKTGEPSRVIDL